MDEEPRVPQKEGSASPAGQLQTLEFVRKIQTFSD